MFFFQRRPKSERPLSWGPWSIPFGDRQNNFAFFGTTGSGKTLGFIQQYANILPRITPDGTQRALIYDKKGDALPILAELRSKGLIHPDVETIHFNPQDSRSHAWHVAEDIKEIPFTQREEALQRLVLNLFPREPNEHSGNSSFFRKSLVGIGAAVFRVLAASGSDWTLADGFQILGDQATRNSVLARDAKGRQFLEVGAQDTRMDVQATIMADLVPFGQLASVMQLASRKKKTFTIHDWLDKPSILVISGPPSKEEPLAYLNRTFLTEMIQTLVYRPDTSDSITWFFLDEAPSIGHLPAFESLLRECRSKGASTFLGIQDICAFQQTLDNRDLAHSLLAQITNLAFFLVPDFDTASWASNRCGSAGMIVDPANRATQENPRFPAAKFQSQRQFHPRHGLPGIFLTRNKQPRRAVLKPLLLKNLTGPDAETRLGHCPWPDDALHCDAFASSPFAPGAGLASDPPPPRANLMGRLPTTGRVEVEI